MTAELSAVAEAIRSNDRFLVTTHENPDGDALGSLLAAKLALDALGKDVVMYLAGEAPLPREYAWMPFGNLRRTVPEDANERVLLALDCASETRLGPDPEVLASAPLVVNVDHHHDNSRFGAINLVVADASSTSEILHDLDTQTVRSTFGRRVLHSRRFLSAAGAFAVIAIVLVLAGVIGQRAAIERALHPASLTTQVMRSLGRGAGEGPRAAHEIHPGRIRR